MARQRLMEVVGDESPFVRAHLVRLLHTLGRRVLLAAALFGAKSKTQAMTARSRSPTRGFAKFGSWTFAATAGLIDLAAARCPAVPPAALDSDWGAYSPPGFQGQLCIASRRGAAAGLHYDLAALPSRTPTSTSSLASLRALEARPLPARPSTSSSMERGSATI